MNPPSRSQRRLPSSHPTGGRLSVAHQVCDAPTCRRRPKCIDKHEVASIPIDTSERNRIALRLPPSAASDRISPGGPASVRSFISLHARTNLHRTTVSARRRAGGLTTLIAAELDAYNAAARDETRRAGARIVDITVISRSYPGLVADEGLHPSAAQYASWVERIAPLADAALRSPD